MAKKGIDVKIELSPQLLNFFQSKLPNKLVDARKNAVHAAGMVWADETKDITTNENHVDTGFYVNSIGYSTGSPSDPLYEMDEGKDITRLMIGANVPYASVLEKRYSLMARGLDVSKSRIQTVTTAQVKTTLGL